MSGNSPQPIDRVQRWEARTAWPMFVLSVVFFAASVWSLADDSLPVHLRTMLALLILGLWIHFIVDFVLRMAVSRRPVAFIRSRWYELVSLVLPLLRPFLILAYLWRLPLFDSFGAAGQRARYLVSVASFALLFVYTASTAVWFVERHDPHANIVDLRDAIWWGFCTIATVGYGDFTPVTTFGRVLAVGLMLSGIVVIGVTSAAFISALTERVHRAGAGRGRVRRGS
ncbi:potassium channel family protein [Microbacterium sp.]|uniref:potassium channel family protein n=1 Tax=Microbacterium sp. TaxID=51671 RepID=UPI0037CB3179